MEITETKYGDRITLYAGDHTVPCYGDIDKAAAISVSFYEYLGPLNDTVHKQKMKKPSGAATWSDVLRHLVDKHLFDMCDIDALFANDSR
tara:strand:- start:886 stop:1155 length:270 start_codon:yes stop_codon:yes gene_type:complete